MANTPASVTTSSAADVSGLLAETLPVQVWTSKPDGALDFVSEQTARQFGVDPATLLRDGWKDVVHPDDLASAGGKWMHSLSTGEPYEVQFRLRMADGSFVWHLARALAHRSADGAILRWYGTNTNIEAEREQQRRVQAMLDEIVKTSNDLEGVVTGLHRDLAAARARIAELESKADASGVAKQ